ncbi:tyrosine-type recombinase/integrase [Methylobacterium sp. NPDC080182]|uniref:tyrosine-type recombinase/integrase n=1 Tax=Methylobacterium sp. NPDC080182 TaxID=3390590 RepID=UPI003D0517E7
MPNDLVAQLTALPTLGGPFWQWGRTTAWRYVKAVMAAAGIIGLHASPKGLRRGFGVHAVRSGVPLNLLQRWLGHEDIATTAIYADLMGAEEQEIAAMMWKSPII